MRFDEELNVNFFKNHTSIDIIDRQNQYEILETKGKKVLERYAIGSYGSLVYTLIFKKVL